ncbi:MULTISPECIES: amidohydrolase [Streptomyces]|uniref:Amidohydrolase n=1 Tax=Streptomyces morookaense TaxID=1970 RepID=A0A7Y7B3C8_STRMO|nr:MULTISPECIES: amidohydrolase [Streptomyces]MCC2279229.1 amidohydrolase [Streptomyces sp. ET3-23]NVK78276.1 amidohydrolase [Streptomyces morookaense]GHF30994.1 amidohydrolase [Streptomyces morookaense]
MDGIPPLVDQYSRGAVHGELGIGVFERHLAEAAGSTGPAPPGTSFFDSRAGLAVRRWCPPLLGLEPHCPPVHYLARRRELGAYRSGQLLLRGAGIGTFLLESGRPGEITSPAELACAAEGRAHEVVRLEQLAARIADSCEGADAFLARTAEALHAAARTATAFASGAAGCDGSPPGAAEVRDAAGNWLRTRRRGAPPAGQILARHLLWSAVAVGLPVQLHCPDPQRLTGFLRATAGTGTDLVLLPDPWRHRQAARLAAVFPHVYADVGTRPEETLREAPFGKLLFSTGARALAELYVVAARLFVRAMEKLMGDWVADGWCRLAEAGRIVSLVAAGTARRVYRLDVAAG